MSSLYIGLMSGTSCDAIDGVIVSFLSHHNSSKSSLPVQLLATHRKKINSRLKQAILKLNSPSANEIHHLGEVDHCLGELFSTTCLELLHHSQINPKQITAIGSHGQTVRHHPDGKYPFTIQIGDPNIIAARTGITTVADFRRKDISLKGQGAPLAPGFHAFLLQDTSTNRWILNIGGIANLTWLPRVNQPNENSIIGFDTGPGNCLMDDWCFIHTQKHFDDEGKWALQGKTDQKLLDLLLQDAYFQKKHPKSTGREYFNLKWLNSYLEKLPPILSCDIQATLLELTAKSIFLSTQAQTERADELWLCGGGSYNCALVERLQQLFSPIKVQTTLACGFAPEWIEAAAFAWLAHQTLNHLPSNIPSVTGATKATVLGAIYPI